MRVFRGVHHRGYGSGGSSGGGCSGGNLRIGLRVYARTAETAAQGREMVRKSKSKKHP